MEDLTSLDVGLFDPGMTHLHRVGLAGLYMTLKNCRIEDGKPERLDFELSTTRVKLMWNGDAKRVLDAFFRWAFRVSSKFPEGVIEFAGHTVIRMGDLQRIELSKAILGSYLQHYQQNRIPKTKAKRTLNVSLENRQVLVNYRPFVKAYAHCDAAEHLFTKGGQLIDYAKIKGWLYPGAIQRHERFGNTVIGEPPQRFICLLFAPVASLYYHIRRLTADGKVDRRRSTVVCMPHIIDLEKYARSYQRYLTSPVDRLSAAGLGDAALSALVALKGNETIEDLGVSGCAVQTMGTLPWKEPQQTKTDANAIEEVSDRILDSFEVAIRCLPNEIVITGQKRGRKGVEKNNGYIVRTSLARAWIADNIATGRNWFDGFWNLMKSKQLARDINRQRKGLKLMVEQAHWKFEADKCFVDAVHVAIRNRYGALASRAKQRGEVIRFDREFERMRTGLMRAKNVRTLRAELADLFARGGINKTLQTDWRTVLPLFVGGRLAKGTRSGFVSIGLVCQGGSRRS